MTAEANDRGDRGALDQIAQHRRALTEFIERNGGQIKRPAGPTVFREWLVEHFGQETPQSIQRRNHFKHTL